MKNIFERKSGFNENQIKIDKISKFFLQKRKEFFNFPGTRDIKKGVYPKPYAKEFRDVDFGEALRELNLGDKERALDILNKMIEEAVKILPNNPEIKEMRNLVKDIEEAKPEELAKIETIHTEFD